MISKLVVPQQWIYHPSQYIFHVQFMKMSTKTNTSSTYSTRQPNLQSHKKYFMFNHLMIQGKQKTLKNNNTKTNLEDPGKMGILWVGNDSTLLHVLGIGFPNPFQQKKTICSPLKLIGFKQQVKQSLHQKPAAAPPVKLPRLMVNSQSLVWEINLKNISSIFH